MGRNAPYMFAVPSLPKEHYQFLKALQAEGITNRQAVILALEVLRDARTCPEGLSESLMVVKDEGDFFARNLARVQTTYPDDFRSH